MGVLQLVLFPPLIKVVGIAMWQRLGFFFGVLAFLAVPAVKTLSWNYASLFVASVVTNTLVMCSLGAVSDQMSVTGLLLLDKLLVDAHSTRPGGQ